MCFLTILTYSLFVNNSEKIELWVPFYVKKGPLLVPFLLKIGSPFYNFWVPLRLWNSAFRLEDLPWLLSTFHLPDCLASSFFWFLLTTLPPLFWLPNLQCFHKGPQLRTWSSWEPNCWNGPHFPIFLGETWILFALTQPITRLNCCTISISWEMGSCNICITVWP